MSDHDCPECGEPHDSLDALLEHGDREHDVVLRWAEHGIADGPRSRVEIGPLTVEWGGLR